MNILVTGGAGFIGSNFIIKVLKKNQDKIVNLDLLTYAGNLENLAECEGNSNYRFVKGDIGDSKLVHSIIEEEKIEAIVNFAAESHVDRSIDGPKIFVETNVLGTQNLLQVAKELSVKRFLQVSTDEVYGSLGKDGFFTEQSMIKPNSPYSASKASADHFCRAWYHTFNFPAMITRCSNNYGPYQFPEKLIPLMIANALDDKELPIYGDGKNVRDWLHVDDHCDAIYTVLTDGKPGAVYNIGGNNEMENIQIVELLLEMLGKDKSLIKFVKDRPGHDQRYAIDASLIKQELGWEPSYTFETGIKETVQWYLDNRKWWERVRSGSYQEYYSNMYGSDGRHKTK
ncbi:dTDP-glucose 4,6-dehydratase [bacterium]|nr:dTDP-glucose 4,6-dehydratase [bacterium]